MDPKCTGDIFKHLEKQSELLMDSYRSMTHELHKLQVEEEMLMRKFYGIMTANGLTKKNQDGSNDPDDGENRDNTAIVIATSNSQNQDGNNDPNDGENRDNTAIVIATINSQNQDGNNDPNDGENRDNTAIVVATSNSQK